MITLEGLTKRYWARKALADRGGLVLVVARYVPGGRTAVTCAMGTVRYPLRSFTFFAGVAAVSWGVYCSLVGYIGGKAFEENPLKGVLALTITLLVEVVRHQRRKRLPVPAADREPPPKPSTPGRTAPPGANPLLHPSVRIRPTL